MEAADDVLKESLNEDLADYLKEIEKTEIIWMAVFMGAMFIFFLAFFVCKMFKTIAELEVMNFILNKLVLISRK